MVRYQVNTNNMNELDKIIEELESWHIVRGVLNEKNDRQGSYPTKNKLVMGTLPRAIEQLKKYKELLNNN